MTSPDIIDVSAQPAIATWTADSHACCRLEALKLHIFHDPSTNSAFFKLRVPVTFQAAATKPKRTTAAWLFIAPEKIATLAFEEEEDQVDEATRKHLVSNVVCLRFDLNRPATLVLPPDFDQDCKGQSSCETLGALQSLARTTSFAISASLPGRTVSQARLLSLCVAASRSTSSSCAKTNPTSGTLASSKHAADTASLYGGKGGRVIEGDSPALLAMTGSEVSPPPYANIGASPPPVLASEPDKKRRRRASSDAGPESETSRKHLSKGFDLKAAFEEFKSELRSELKQDLRKELLVELRDEMKHELRAELKTELISEVMQEVETRVFKRVQQCIQEQADDFETQLYDVRHEIGSTVYSEVEDQTHAARKELEEYVKDEMDEAQKRVEDRIVDRLQNANLNLTFNDL